MRTDRRDREREVDRSAHNSTVTRWSTPGCQPNTHAPMGACRQLRPVSITRGWSGTPAKGPPSSSLATPASCVLLTLSLVCRVRRLRRGLGDRRSTRCSRATEQCSSREDPSKGKVGSHPGDLSPHQAFSARHRGPVALWAKHHRPGLRRPARRRRTRTAASRVPTWPLAIAAVSGRRTRASSNPPARSSPIRSPRSPCHRRHPDAGPATSRTCGRRPA